MPTHNARNLQDAHDVQREDPFAGRPKAVVMKRFRTTALTAASGALLVFVLLLPARGVDSDPPECHSFFGYVVPCGLGPEQDHGAGFAGAGAITAALLVIVGSAAGRQDRRRS
jgi:hypothetical protein